jgi:hypothetical protein
MTLAIIALIIVALAAVGAVFYGNSCWQEKTKILHAKMQAVRLPIAPTAYDARELETLPPPVKRYFRTVLQEGQAMIASVHVIQQGQFRQNETKDNWQRFYATQFVTMRPPSFDWDARVKMAAGVKMYVQDAYAAGLGTLHAAVFGLLTVAEMHGTPELAQGELLRYLGEAAWYPTALLPSQGVYWEGIDDSSARATLTDGTTSASLEFRFDRDGLISTAWAQSRCRIANGAFESAPWQGRFGAYAQRSGMRVPLEAEVEWQLPSGPLPYWRGRLTDIKYEFATH